jgi:hypothetical protein
MQKFKKGTLFDTNSDMAQFVCVRDKGNVLETLKTKWNLARLKLYN